MSDSASLPPPPERVPTGVKGLDHVLGGGVFKSGIYILGGQPGVGKTILANQACYHHVKHGGRALYITLLAETHARMLGQLQTLSFFDPAAVGTSVLYVNGFSPLVSEGLQGLLQLVRRVVRDHKATLLVLDGMVTAEHLANSNIDYKRFINELQTWVGVIGCTVLLLTSGHDEAKVMPEHTMVDGIIELQLETRRARTMRFIQISKFRGSGFNEGRHAYAISDDGIAIYPRLEAVCEERGHVSIGPEQLPSGIPGLDELIGGGIAQRSTTLLLGSSGAGKTLCGLQFLAEGIRRKDSCMHFGFFESPPALLETARRFGFDFEKALKKDLLAIEWRKPSEQVLDELGQHLLQVVQERKVTRLFIDGLVGFKDQEFPERVSGFFSALCTELQRRGVTTFITEETRELYVQNIVVPTGGVSAIFQNIFFLRQNVGSAEAQRIISVMKTRESAHTATPHTFTIGDSGVVVDGVYESGSPTDTGAGLIPTALPQKRSTKRRG
ncbi:MAG: RAD55 family ATPase [Myxococcaceae bacterium]